LIVVDEYLVGLHIVRVTAIIRRRMDAVRAEGRPWMYSRAVIAAMFLIAACLALTAHASEVTTYGAGLKSCATYIDARRRQNSDEVAFVEWFSGYASGVNSTSNHTNNILGDANLKEAVYRLGDYCRAHPVTSVAVALDVLVIGARSTRARQTAEVTTYGTGFKSCSVYLYAREQSNADEIAFVDWLGGYLSGVNAISLTTDNILGNSDLTATIYWIDDYCRANPRARFAEAVDARLAPNHRDQ
jgi:hypothetical protein